MSFESTLYLYRLVLQVSGFALAGYAAGIITYLAAQNLPLSLPTSLAEIPFISGS
jgi:hypothetical protein